MEGWEGERICGTYLTFCCCLQASTLDGVLEVKNEHFWTIAFGSYVSELRQSGLS